MFTRPGTSATVLLRNEDLFKVCAEHVAFGEIVVPGGFCIKPQPLRFLPSGKHTKSYGKWPFIVDFPIQNGDFP